jgi:hypothetical protein
MYHVYAFARAGDFLLKGPAMFRSAIPIVFLMIASAVSAQKPVETATPWHGVVTGRLSLLPSDSWVDARLAATSQQTAASVRAALELLEDAGNRRGEKRGRTRAAFENLAKSPDGRIWSEFGFGLMEAQDAVDPDTYGSGSHGVLNTLTFMIGKSAPQDAQSHLTKVLQADPTFDPAAIALANVALLVRSGDMLRSTDNLLSNARSSSPELRRLRIEISNALGDLSHSADSVDGAGCDDALVMRSIAEARLRTPTDIERGGALYYRAVDCMTSETADRFAADIMLLFDDVEMASWRDASVESRRALIREFWKWRAAQTGVSENERLAEHYRRLAEVNTTYYAWPPYMTVGGDSPYMVEFTKAVAGPKVFDHRAALYLRHGKPDEVINTASPRTFEEKGTTPIYETWYYATGGPKLAFHFIRGRSSQYELTSLPGCREDLWFRTRSHIDGRFNRMCINRGRSGAVTAGMLNSEINRELRDVYRGATVSESVRPFTAEMPFYYDLFRLAGARGLTDVVAAIAVPAASLKAIHTDGVPEYQLALSLIVFDTISRSVTRRDTMVVLRPGRELKSGELLRTHIELPVRPSLTTAYRIVIRDPNEDRRGMAYGGPFAIASFPSSGLGLSDIVLAEAADGGAWKRGSERLTLVPFQEFPGGELDVFYEVYNVMAQSRLKTRVVIAPTQSIVKRLFTGAKAVNVAFEETAAPDENGIVRIRRRLRASNVPGEYTIKVTVTDVATGKEQTQERRFRIVP